MHSEAQKFLSYIKTILPFFFVNKRVIDIGSGDINGNNRHLFEKSEYIGVDVIKAPNVDIVSRAKDLPDTIGTFDVVISSECFEHDMQLYDTFQRILELLKPDSLFLFTCAGIGRPEHGTLRTSPHDSYSLKQTDSTWYPNYYQNLSMDDIVKIMPLEKYFNEIHFYRNNKSNDLYFYGIRNSNQNQLNINLSEFIFNKHNTDKNMFFHNYIRQYKDYLEKFKYKNIKILEIGVYNGDSLRAWRELFPNATHVVGLDIDDSCKVHENINNAIYVDIGNATHKNFIDNIHQKYGSFDLIIDDGSHKNSDIIQTFELLFPLMNNKGLYIVEDTICYKSKDHLDNAYPNHIDYFTKYLPFLNQWRFDSTEGIKDHCIDPFKIHKKTQNVFEYSIDKIDFGCSFIALHKLIREHWI